MINKSILVLLNTPINEKIFKFLYDSKIPLVCADGAANRLYAIDKSIIPQKIIGDLDSLEEIIMNHYKSNGSEIIKINDQDTTDFEKILINIQSDEYIVYGGLSKRLDQTLYNFHVLSKFQLNGLIVGESSILRLIKKGHQVIELNQLESKKGVGIFPIKHFARIQTVGLKWDLQQDNPLIMGEFTSASNEFLDQKITIDCLDDFYLITQMKEEFQ